MTVRRLSDGRRTDVRRPLGAENILPFSQTAIIENEFGKVEAAKNSLTKVTKDGSPKKEAVKIIQRALVDMGIRVDKKNHWGVTSLRFPKPSKDWNSFQKYPSRFGEFINDLEYGNDQAVWPRDDKKYLVDGIPGEKTRNAVMRLSLIHI